MSQLFEQTGRSWDWEYIGVPHRRVADLDQHISRFKCKDRINNINFHFLEYHRDKTKKYFLFRTKEDRMLFILTYI